MKSSDEDGQSNGDPACNISMFLQDDALTERICSDLEQLKYAKILTSLAMGPLLVRHDHGVPLAQEEHTVRSLSKSECLDVNRKEFSRREKRRIKPTKKVREWNQVKLARPLGKRRNSRGTRGSGGPREEMTEDENVKITEENAGEEIKWTGDYGNLKGNAGNLKGKAANLKDKATNVKDKTANVRDKTANLKDKAANLIDKAASDFTSINNMGQSDGNVGKFSSKVQEEARETTMAGVQGTVNRMLVDESASLKSSRYRCEQCGKGFKTYYTYSIHIRMPDHTEETPFVCDICGKGFRLSSTLCRHKIIHTSHKPHQCKVCFKTFNRSSTLKMHMRTHSGRKQHVCAECGKGFHQKGNLRNHMFVHSGERPFHCESCGRHFNKKSNLKHHLKIHELNGNLACTVCKTMFPRNEELRNHMEMVHCK